MRGIVQVPQKAEFAADLTVNASLGLMGPCHQHLKGMRYLAVTGVNLDRQAGFFNSQVLT